MGRLRTMPRHPCRQCDARDRHRPEKPAAVPGHAGQQAISPELRRTEMHGLGQEVPPRERYPGGVVVTHDGLSGASVRRATGFRMLTGGAARQAMHPDRACRR